MQKEIDRFNREFVRLATAYVERVAQRAQQKEPDKPGAAQQFRLELEAETRLANALAVNVRRMQEANGGYFNELPEDGQQAGPGMVFQNGRVHAKDSTEPAVKLGPGVSFNLKDTSLWRAMKETLAALWGLDTEHMWFDVTPQKEDTAQAAQEAAQDVPAAAPGTDTTTAADGRQGTPESVWEVMRDILTGKRPAPEGAVFNVTIDTGATVNDVRMKTDEEKAAEMAGVAWPWSAKDQ